MKKWLLLLNLVFGIIGLGQIWMVQLSSYPLWAYVGPHEFYFYHIAWWHSIWVPLFIPAGLSILCTIGLFWLRPPVIPRLSIWMAVVLLAVTYGLTFIWWAPIMALIGANQNEFQAVFGWAPLLDKLGFRNKTQVELFNLLMTTHWLRVALISGYASIIFWMVFIAFDPKRNK